MVEHFEHKKISSDHRAISSISPIKNFEQNRAFFERNQTFFEHDRAESTVNTNVYKIFQVIGIVLYWFRTKVWKPHIFLIFTTQKVQIFSIFPYQVLISIFERSFRALSFDPSDLEHKIFDLLSIRAKIEQIFFRAFRSRSWSSGWIFERSEPIFERSYAWSQL